MELQQALVVKVTNHTHFHPEHIERHNA